MDLTERLMKLKEITGIEVYQDICTDDKKEMYIVYVYQDERPVLCGDNHVLIDGCELYISLYTPVGFDYFKKKDKIREYLEGSDFTVRSIQTRVETFNETADRIRRTTFDCVYTEFRQ